MTDAQSPLAVKIMNANPHAYEALVGEGGTPALARELLVGVKPDQLLTTPIKSPPTADAMLAGLWLWHDALEESHTLSQKLDAPDAEAEKVTRKLKEAEKVTSTDLTIEEMKRERDSRNHTAHPRNLATTRLPCLRRLHRLR